MAKTSASKDKFYPIIIRSEPPVHVTREWVDNWYAQRGTHIKVLHIPATNPREERTGQI